MTVTYSKWSEVPAELRAAQKYKGAFGTVGDEEGVCTTCAAWSYESGVLHLVRAITVPSHEVQRRTGNQKLTYHSECWEGGAIWFHFQPIEGSENAESNQAGGSPQV